ncbi:hypothetical protein BB559_006998 [Furculomyces boomerangus]|uniref:TAP42-like protein n=1 Tax=Furculomyces boomerangus TaxID=61424 RepID=A0A2T9XZF1_9FUNG|nr:hypothetical protein BB559_006998 [Furculomyces boomerangus]
MDSQQNSSLNSMFLTVKTNLEKIESLNIPATSFEYQELVSKSLYLLEKCEESVEKLALFSSNETIEDYQTSTLEYLLIPILKSNLLKRKIENRLSLLEQSKDEVYYHKIMNGIKFEPVEQRKIKIDRFKAERELKNRIENLENKIHITQQQSLKKLDNENSENNESDEFDILDEVDDMDFLQRDHVVLLLALKAKLAIEELISIKSEVDLLSKIQNHSSFDDERNRSGGSDNRTEKRGKDVSWKLDTHSYTSGPVDFNTRNVGGKLLDSKGKPIQTFVITNNRTLIKEGVFKPGHSLPTKTLDDFIEEEFARGNVITGGGKEPEPKEDPDDNDEEAINAETMKKREWDDYTDDVRKGSGNTTNKG